MAKFLRTIFWIILVAALLTAGAIFLPPMFGIRTEVIDSNRVTTNLPYASVSYLDEVVASELKGGDKILIEEDGAMTAYKITGVTDSAAGQYSVLSISDTTGATETMTLTSSVQRIYVTIPFIGYAVIATQSTEGYIILGLILLFEIVLFVLSEIWKRSSRSEEDNYDPRYDEVVPEMKEQPAPQRHVFNSELEEEIAANVAEFTKQNDDRKDTVPILSAEEEYQEIESVLKTEEPTQDLTPKLEKEVLPEASEEPEKEVVLPEKTEEPVIEIAEEKADEEGFLPVNRPTLDELLDQARRSGDKPTVEKDEDTGITLVDYSDLI